MQDQEEINNYYEKANTSVVKLLVVGQDPYPNGANGLAFCKGSFDELMDEYCCGKEVLKSLGIDLHLAQKKYGNPIKLWFDLLDSGVAFTNVCDTLLDLATPEDILRSNQLNKPLFSKSQNIVLLGKSKALNVFKTQHPEIELSEILIHPSLKAKKYNLIEWEKVWSSDYLYVNYLQKNIKNPIKMNIEKYFDLDVPSSLLYSKGETISGKHGIEIIDGDYFASHFHLKTKIAKGDMKKLIEDSNPKDLYARASSENEDFSSWPEVQYEGDNYKIRKYKFSWLVKHLQNQ